MKQNNPNEERAVGRIMLFRAECWTGADARVKTAIYPRRHVARERMDDPARRVGRCEMAHIADLELNGVPFAQAYARSKSTTVGF